MIWLQAFVGVVVTFLVLDAIWIGVFVKKYYDRTVGHLMRSSPNVIAAVIFYVMYCAGVVVLAIAPAVPAGDWAHAMLAGAVLGALAYGAFTLTNMAILEGWTWGLVASDMAWGAFVTAICAVAGLQAARLTF